MVAVGSPVADFTVHSSSGYAVTLSELKGKKVVLYFYPKDDTPGCTLEGQDFNRLRSKYEAENAVVYGVSKDSVSSHCKFRDKYGFEFELLSDESGRLCEQFDVIKEKNNYGKKYMGIERSTFIIDENGKLAKEYRKVSAAGHAEAVLNDIKAM